MDALITLFENFFTHKDNLPPPDQWPGTMFSPLQLGYYAVMTALMVFFCIKGAKAKEQTLKRIFTVLWVCILVLEPGTMIWETLCATPVSFDWEGGLSLWACSIFIYTLPFAIWGKGWVRTAACGYICTLGLLGGTINFFYPANVLARYSCISLPGFYTLFFHGAIVFCAVTMLTSGYHSFKDVKSVKQLFIPAIPALIVSIPANIANLLIDGADYMFFKMRSFFFAPIGRALPMWATVILVYIIYLIIHALPYLPSFFANRRKGAAA